MYFVPVDELVGGALLGSASLILPSYPSAQKVVMPLFGAAVFVYQRDTLTQWACYTDEHGAGAPVAQPCTTDSDGHAVTAGGAQVFTGQPAELDVVISGAGLPAALTLRVGRAPDVLVGVNTTGLTSAQIDTAYQGAAGVPAVDGRLIMDATNHLLLVREGGKWYASAALTQIA